MGLGASAAGQASTSSRPPNGIEQTVQQREDARRGHLRRGEPAEDGRGIRGVLRRAVRPELAVAGVCADPRAVWNSAAAAGLDGVRGRREGGRRPAEPEVFVLTLRRLADDLAETDSIRAPSAKGLRDSELKLAGRTVDDCAAPGNRTHTRTSTRQTCPRSSPRRSRARARSPAWARSAPASRRARSLT